MNQIARLCRRHLIAMAALLVAVAAGPAATQSIQSIDPSTAIDADLDQPARSDESLAYPQWEDTPAERSAVPANTPYVAPQPAAPVTSPNVVAPASAAPATQAPVAQAYDDTYREDDLIGAAEGVFGKGAEGLARMIEDILKKQGEPNAYIVGREAGGAFIFGARYGSGTLFHKVEGQRPVYWTGPSVGLDAGANAGNTFVLVYNLYDTEELYERFPAAEGQAYLIGGFHASYMRKDDIVLIPIRVGAGLRLGVSAGYMKFSKKQRWLPF